MERKNWEEGGQVRRAPLSGASLVALREGESDGGREPARLLQFSDFVNARKVRQTSFQKK